MTTKTTMRSLARADAVAGQIVALTRPTVLGQGVSW